MKVYLVKQEVDFADYFIHGIFSSREKAEKYMARSTQEERTTGSVFAHFEPIEEFELDEGEK